MNSYLICWKPASENPEKGWPEEKLAALAYAINEKGPVVEPWRFNKRKGLAIGERVFLIRQGKQGHAILGYGHIRALPQSPDSPVPILFEAVVDPSSDKVFATADELQEISTMKMPWNTQSSGIALQKEIALALETKIIGRTPIQDTKRTPPNRNPNWTRDELILALDLYFREPASRGNQTHIECIKLSEYLNKLPIHYDKFQGTTFRNPNGVAMKLSNFLKYDPKYSGKGLSAASRLEKEVWDTYSTNQEQLRGVAKAIREETTILLASKEKFHDDEDAFEAPEGRILYASHKKRERDPKLVRKKKEQVRNQTGKLLCEVCGFDFAKVYGKLGEGFAECHHGRAVSSMRPGELTKLSELHIVCANCHRMLHRNRTLLSVTQLRDLIFSLN